VRSAFARVIMRELRRDRLRLMGTRSGQAGEAGLDEARRRRAKSGWDVGIRTPITASRDGAASSGDVGLGLFCWCFLLCLGGVG
jgi:hypothetical protein